MVRILKEQLENNTFYFFIYNIVYPCSLTKGVTSQEEEEEEE